MKIRKHTLTASIAHSDPRETRRVTLTLVRRGSQYLWQATDPDGSQYDTDVAGDTITAAIDAAQRSWAYPWDLVLDCDTVTLASSQAA